ncbi:MAG TPA: glycosyltransferase, partial [Porticoccaceae bacterium]|nr:glycosyltransferase [Porticoccaceae bacterium]
MKIAVVAPGSVPYTIGGAEKLWWGLVDHINSLTSYDAELVKLSSPERTFPELMASYRRFSELDLSGFDRIISTKYPAWMVDHPDHVVYMQHKLRGLYDAYHFCGKPKQLDPDS